MFCTWSTVLLLFRTVPSQQYDRRDGGGNRGQCAQPCRLLYRTPEAKRPQYLLSLKDICTLELIPEMIESGIYSFKIEAG